MWTERLTGKHPLKAMMGGQLDLPDPIWKRLTIAWVVFFVLMAGLNLLVASLFSMDTWVNFKLFGSLGLTFAFVLAQGIWISRFAKEPG
jgi:intracellular septation protein